MLDSDVVNLIDDLMYRLKVSYVKESLADEFYKVLKTFVKTHGLDSDPHLFASLPVQKKE